MKLISPFLVSDKDMVLQERKETRPSSLECKTAESRSSVRYWSSPLPACVTSARVKTTPGLSFFFSKMGIIIIIPIL